MAHTSTPISEYAVLGDGYTAALVSRRGSIDWACLPNFDSSACFAALLGTPENGRWLLTIPDATSVTRTYRGNSFVLETTYVSPTGTARVTDAMPSGNDRADIVRRLEVLSGTVTVEHEWVVRFGYGQIEPWVSRVVDDVAVTDAVHASNPDQDRSPRAHTGLRAIAGPDSLLLRGDRLPTASKDAVHRHVDTFSASEGDVLNFVCTWTQSWQTLPPAESVTDRLNDTEHHWESWIAKSTYNGPHKAAVIRSLLVLRMLTHAETGGIVAAPTTSLPEDFGGERNWDYRYCWLRDAAMTVEALVEAGFDDEVWRWRDWLLRAVAGRPEDVQIMYGVDGRRDLPEVELDHLPGYAGSRPVRVGNAAVKQVQNDVLGEIMCALDLARSRGGPASEASWSLQCQLMNDLVTHWHVPDRGLWEVRGPTRRFVHSAVMSWAAMDRAVRAVEIYGREGPVDLWRDTRERIHAEVLARGWDEELGSFVQYYGAKHVDAALLQMIQVGFLPADDPRMRSTVRRIQADLSGPGGLILRYSLDHADDGLSGTEHPFLVCCFWLVDALARMGEVDEASELFDTIVGTANDVGLMAEEFNYAEDHMAGNFPQAFSHLGLVRAAHSLDAALRARESGTPETNEGETT